MTGRTRWSDFGRRWVPGPHVFHFLVVVAGFAGNHHQKKMILEGPRPSKPPCVGDRVTSVK